jgi:hypothetical protein
MSRSGTYYLARITKSPNVTKEMLESAMLSPDPIERYGSAWSLINVLKSQSNGNEYISGRLVKYDPKGKVSTVDPERRESRVQDEPNLMVANSPFVYIPSHSGIAFLRVSNQIPEWNFIDRFARVVRESLGGILIECDVNLVSDLATFSSKLRGLTKIYGISASVQPPNPLFGPLWKQLHQYIKKRNTGRLTIREDSGTQESLSTDLPALVEAAASPKSDSIPPEAKVVDIGDAAVLMAIDGYGKGKVRGLNAEGDTVVIRTTDTRISFVFESEPDFAKLYERAFEIFEALKAERKMEHGA